MKKVFLFFATTLASAIAWCDSEIVDGVTWYYTTYNDNGTTCASICTGSEKYVGDLTVPTKIGGYQVRKIGDFNYCSGLTSVNIQYGVRSIEWYAFVGCESLTNVVIASSVTNIGENAFVSCPIRSVILPNGLTRIEGSLFAGCAFLENVVIPESVTTIGMSSFGGCSRLHELIIPSSVTNIEYDAFESCSQISLYFMGNAPDVAHIELTGVLWGAKLFICEGSTGWDVPIPGTWNELDIAYIPRIEKDGIVYRCCGIGSVSAVDYIGEAENLVVPSMIDEYSVVCIEANAFKNCESIVSVIVSEGVTNIDDYAFANCANLTTVSLPDSLEVLHQFAFDGCSSFRNLISSGMDFYGGANFETITNLVIREGATSVGYHAFWYAFELESVSIPSTVTNIEPYAFQECWKLDNVVLPDGLLDIGMFAFTCTGIKSITFPSTLEHVGWQIFSYSKLESLVIPEGVKNIDNRAFMECDHLVSVELPSSLTNISDEAFFCTPRLASVKIPAGVLSIGEFAFFYSGLSSIEISEGVRNIGARAFMNSQLETVIIPSSVTNLQTESFANCGNLWRVEFRGWLTRIAPCTFYCDPNLREIVFPHGLEVIEGSAFGNCSSLTSISLPASVRYIAPDAFTGCPLTSITIDPGGRYYVFNGCIVDGETGEIVYYPFAEARILKSGMRDGSDTILDVVYQVSSSYTNVDARALGYLEGDGWGAIIRPETFVLAPDGNPSVIGANVPGNRELAFAWDVGRDLDANVLGKLKIKLYANPNDALQLKMKKVSDNFAESTNILSRTEIDASLRWYYAKGESDLVLNNGVLYCNSTPLISDAELYEENALRYIFGKMGLSFVMKGGHGFAQMGIDSDCPMHNFYPGVVVGERKMSVYAPSCGFEIDGKYEPIFLNPIATGPVVPYVGDATGDGLWDIVVLADGKTNVYAQVDMVGPKFESVDVGGLDIPVDFWKTNSVEELLRNCELDKPVSEGALSASVGKDGELFVANADGTIWYYQDGFLRQRDWGGTSEGFASGLKIAMVDWDGDGDTDCLYGTSDGRLGLLLDPRPPAPTNLKVMNGYDSTMIFWDSSQQSGIKEYRIYRDDMCVTNSVLPSYRDVDLSEGDYVYEVSAISRFYTAGNSTPIENESMRSAAVTATVGQVLFPWRDVNAGLHEEVKVMLAIENSLNYNVAGRVQTVSFDPDYLTFKGIEKSGITENIEFSTTCVDGTITISVTGAVGGGEPILPAGSGSFLSFVFDTIRAGDTKVGDANVRIVDSDVVPYRYGDLSGDGVLDGKDLQMLSRLMNGNGKGVTSEILMAGDLNGNGRLDQNDHQILKNMLRK